MEPTRMYDLRKDENVEEVKPRVFLRKHFVQVNPEVFMTIKEIMEIWGYERFYDQILEHFARLIQSNSDEDILCNYDTGELKRNMSTQKLLFWSIWDNREKRFGLVGGVLFHEGEMSFHT